MRDPIYLDMRRLEQRRFHSRRGELAESRASLKHRHTHLIRLAVLAVLLLVRDQRRRGIRS